MNAKHRIRLYLGLAAVIALELSFIGSSLSIGPDVMWTGDACPDPHVTCGVFPIGVAIAVLPAAVLLLTVLGWEGETHGGET